MIDWSGEFLQMRANMDKTFRELNERDYRAAIDTLNDIIVNARALRAFATAKEQNDELK